MTTHTGRAERSPIPQKRGRRGQYVENKERPKKTAAREKSPRRSRTKTAQEKTPIKRKRGKRAAKTQEDQTQGLIVGLKIAVSLLNSPGALTVGQITRSKLSRGLRKAVEGRGRFGDFDRRDFDRAAEISTRSGYYRVGAIKRMQEHGQVRLHGEVCMACSGPYRRVLSGNEECARP